MELTPLTQELLNALVPALVSLLGTAITIAAGYGAKWLAARSSSERFQQGAMQLHEVVVDAVAEAEQTTVKAFKLANSDGKLSKEEGKLVRDGVVEVIRRHFGDKGIKAIGNMIGSLVDDGRLRTMVEAEVARHENA